MTTVDDLREQLEELAATGPARSASDLYESALYESTAGSPRRQHTRRPILAVAAAAVLIAAALTTWRVWPDAAVRVTTLSDRPSAAVPPAITVPATQVDAVTVAFGKVWVAATTSVTTTTATLSTTTTVRAYDALNGRFISTIPTTTGAQTLDGGALEFAVTDHAVWLRTSTFDDDVIYRIDPTEMRVDLSRHEANDGPIVGFGDRIAAVDSVHIEIVREDGVELAHATTEQVTQLAQPPGTNAIRWLHLDVHGLWAADEGLGLVVRLGPTLSLLSETYLPHTAVAGTTEAETTAPNALPDLPTWWFWTGPGPGGSPLLGARLDQPGAVLREVAVPDGSQLVGQIDDHRVLLIELAPNASHDVIFDTTTGKSTDLPRLSGKAGRVVVMDGVRALLAAETSTGDSTLINFEAVPG